MPTAVEVQREYEVRYPRRFPPALIESPRREMLHSLLEHVAARAVPGRLLDVGCGGGHFMAAAAGHGWTVLGTDLSREACAAARRVAGAPVVQAEAEALPFRASTVDAVALVNVLDHTTRPLAVVREAARVLRPGGRLLLVDMLAHDRREYQQQMGHVWLGFAPAQIAAWLEAAGFTSVRVQPLPPAPQAAGPALFAASARRH